MNNSIDLKKIEKKAYMSYHADGLFDLVVGFALLLYGFALFNDFVSISAIITVLIVVIMPKLKKKITYPRLGYVQFPREVVKRKKAFLVVVLTIVMLLGLLFFFLLQSDKVSPILQQTVSDSVPFVVGVLVVSIFLTLAYLQKITRLYAYAGMIVLFYLTAPLVPWHLPHYLLITGIVFTIVGIILLINFIKKYPLPPKDVHHAE